MDDNFKHGLFALVFFGDAQGAFFARNWDLLLARLKSELWDGAGAPPYWDALICEMNNPEEWDNNNYGPWHYTTDIGEGRLTIYRLTE